jgi:hypothetical protein
MTLLEQIADLELVKVRYRLKLLEPFHFEPEMILHWRKELLRGAGRAAESSSYQPCLFKALLDPRPADDPYAKRQFQKPSPPFIIDPIPLRAKQYVMGELLPIDILFPGDSVIHANTFARLLIGLGEFGIFKGGGRFEVDSFWTMNHQGDWDTTWSQGEDLDGVPMSILSIQWLIKKNLDSLQPLSLKFVTPARLLKNNRPLFKPLFSDIFPFMLRRVTSVLYSCCHLEVNLDAGQLIQDAQTFCSQNMHLTWEDWRYLNADHGIQGIGGVSGVLQLDAGMSDDMQTLLRLAELFHLGKGASYGAGCFILAPVKVDLIENR